MQAILDQCRDSVAEIGRGCRTTDGYKEECLKLGRYTAKTALILAELELQLHADDALAGSEQLYLAMEAMAAALAQAASLVRQSSATTAARIWPLEDSIEFQSVGLALLEAISKTAALDIDLPEDVIEDLGHVQRQLRALQFTETELEESEIAELAAVQLSEKRARNAAPEPEIGTPPAGAITSASKPFGSPAVAAPAAVAAAVPGEGEVDESWDGEEGGDENDGEEAMGMEEGEGEEGEGAAEVTALQPGAPAKGAVPKEAEASILPNDPFSMAEGAAVEERGRLASTALQELSALKKG